MLPGQISATGMMKSITGNHPMEVPHGLQKNGYRITTLIPIFLACLFQALWFILSGQTTVLKMRKFTIVVRSIPVKRLVCPCD